MIDQLAAFGALCLIALAFIFIVSSMNAKDQKDKDNIDLSKYLDGSRHTYKPIDSYEGKKELRKILSDPEVRRKAEERRNEDIKRKQKEADLKRKDTIIKRTFSYRYEIILYEIFAPYARKKNIEHNGQIWEIPFGKTLENSYVISEISRLLALSSEEANKLFWEFEKNDMLHVDNEYIENGTILGERVKSDRCSFGSLLQYDWNIISNEDMNLSKWIEQHPDRESKDSADQRRGVVKEHISFNEYVKREGDFSISFKSPYIEMKFQNGHTLYLTESQIGMPSASYRYRMNEFIESISDKLSVDIDDNQHTLRLEKGEL